MTWHNGKTTASSTRCDMLWMKQSIWYAMDRTMNCILSLKKRNRINNIELTAKKNESDMTLQWANRANSYLGKTVQSALSTTKCGTSKDSLHENPFCWWFGSFFGSFFVPFFFYCVNEGPASRLISAHIMTLLTKQRFFFAFNKRDRKMFGRKKPAKYMRIPLFEDPFLIRLQYR